jgi:hypothetical protein
MIAEQKDNNQEIRDRKVVFGSQYWHTWNSAQLSLSGLASPASFVSLFISFLESEWRKESSE